MFGTFLPGVILKAPAYVASARIARELITIRVLCPTCCPAHARVGGTPQRASVRGARNLYQARDRAHK
jgi:hypothetical protein